MGGTRTAKSAGELRVREARRPVNLMARMRTSAGWCDITIRNISSRGFMAQCQMPPRRGFYIEAWRGDVCIVGQVVWCTGSRFGVRTQARIDFQALVASRAIPTAGTERRSRDRSRLATRPPLQIQTERARRIGRAFEFVILCAGAVTAAGFIASSINEVLRKPFATIEAHLTHANAQTP